MSIYREIRGSRRLEWRIWEPRAAAWTDWVDGGPATPDTLTVLEAAFASFEPGTYELRQVCRVASETGTYIGTLIFDQPVIRHETLPIGEQHAPAQTPPANGAA